MKLRKLLTSFYICLIGFGSAQASAELFDFEYAPLGNMDKESWSETWVSDSGQQCLFQVTDDIGFKNSTGLSIAPETTLAGYRMVNQKTLTGKEFSVSAKFRIEIDNNETDTANHGLFGLYFNTAPEWYTGKRVDLMLLRRRTQDLPIGRFGLTSLVSNGVPAGWIEPSSLGLPNQLADSEESVTSDWFTMQLTLKSTDDGLWNIYCYVLDEEGSSVEALGAEGIELAPEFLSSESIHAGIIIQSEGAKKYKTLKEGGLSGLFIDDFIASSSE